MSIHGIKRSRVRQIQQKLLVGDTNPKDQRGKHGNNAFKTPPEIINLIESHIKSLPLRQSHYTLRKTPNAYYLGDEYESVTQLYENFLQKFQIAVSEKIYRQVFNKFNIHFGWPRSDTCATCDEYNHEVNMAKIRKDVEKVKKLQRDHTKHLMLYEKYKGIVQSFCRRAKKKKLNVLSFDYMQNLPTPNITVGDMFYSQKLWTYVFGVHNSADESATMFMYDETTGEKGSNNVASLLLYYLKNIELINDKPLVLICDSCPGQNKNYNIVKLCFMLVHIFKMFPSITAIFPVRGHSYMSCDRDFSFISKKKKRSLAETPAEWMNVIRNARKKPSKFLVCAPDWNDFVNISKVDGFLPKSQPPMNIKKARMLKFDSSERMVKIRYAYTGVWSHVNVWPRNKPLPLEVNLSSLYENRLPLKPKKMKDLENLKKYLTKEESVVFYDSIMSNPSNPDFEEDEDDQLIVTEIDLSDNSSGESDSE